jgi:hypothetical protein
MSNKTLKELLHAYSHIPLGLLIFKEKKLFFINKHLRETIMLGNMDNKHSLEIICATLNLKADQEQLFSFLSNNEFFHRKEKYIQISSNSVDDLDIFVFTRLSEKLLKDIGAVEEIDFIPVVTQNTISRSVDNQKHIELLEFFDKKTWR